MLTFVIIGKNVEPTLGKCLSSVARCIEDLKLYESDVVYVDSGSSDNSIKIASAFNMVTICSCYGIVNAAKGRNIGAKVAKSENLVFLDADMEIETDFIASIINENDLLYDFVSGDLLNIFYDENWLPLDQVSPYFGQKMEKDKVEFVTGGFFAVKKSIWNSVSGMDTSLRRGQDLDLGLRLSLRNIFLLRKADLFAKHHTISYFNNFRFRNMLLSGDYLYPGTIIRKNLLNKYAWITFLKWYSTFYILLLFIVASTIFSFFLMPLYLFFPFCRSLFKSSKEGRNFFFHFLSYIIIDINTLFGFLFFYPKKSDLTFNIIKREI